MMRLEGLAGSFAWVSGRRSLENVVAVACSMMCADFWA